MNTKTNNEISFQVVEDTAVGIVETLRLILSDLDIATDTRWQTSPHRTDALKNHTTSDTTAAIALDPYRLTLSEAIGTASQAVLQAKKDLDKAAALLDRALDAYDN